MIQSFASDIALQMGIQLSKISLTDGQPLGCLDTFLLDMTSNGKTVGAMIFKADLEKLKIGIGRDFLEVRIRSTLMRLQRLNQP
ncbi:MAG: hypothetical protein PHI31_06690 [Desulfuromonadaceae bacterium]|nr:hypothetical protein [Desulfuromonadaceae bacterium]